MFHKILQAKPGEYFPMNISVQGDFESIYSNYQNLRMYKGKQEVTQMPRNVHELLNVQLIIHIEAEDAIIEKIYQNILRGENFTLGRNEDMVRIDAMKMIEIKKVPMQFLKHNAYIPLETCKKNEVDGINYQLNTVYQIDQYNLRSWKKVNVKYVEKGSNQGLVEAVIDEEGDLVFFYETT